VQPFELTSAFSYHGGIPSFLRFRNLSASNHAPFYDLDQPVYSDFADYISGLLNHTSTISGLALKNDPTVLAWETGNELKDPPVEWTDAISSVIKNLAPNHLVIDGTYGINKKALALNNVDI
jgi:endo-1,4-beta-mannosidase